MSSALYRVAAPASPACSRRCKAAARGPSQWRTRWYTPLHRSVPSNPPAVPDRRTHGRRPDRAGADLVEFVTVTSDFYPVQAYYEEEAREWLAQGGTGGPGRSPPDPPRPLGGGVCGGV